jgi:hypothetical protein
MTVTGARNELWTRLLSGELTEVFVFGGWERNQSTLGDFLPQALGLEPIVCDAYRYTPDGTPRSHDDLVHLARELAAGKCWIAEGLVPVWAATFMEQAQAILFFNLGWPRILIQDKQRKYPAAELAYLADEYFPEKLLNVTTRRQLRSLRALRIPRS